MPLFFNDDGRDFLKSGCQVTLPDGQCVLIFCDIAIAIADESALHFMYSCKGTSGLKPCLLCINVYNRKIDRKIVENDRTKQSVYHTEEEIDRCKLATTDVIQAIAAKLQAAHSTLGSTAFTELQTRLGWTFNPDGVMYCSAFNRRLCPSRIAVYDWCHVLFVNGIFNHHAGHMLVDLKRLPMPDRIKPETVGDYVKLWTFPKHISSSVHPADVFGEARLKSSMNKG